MSGSSGLKEPPALVPISTDVGRFMSKRHIALLLGVSTKTVMRLVEGDGFPPPVRIGGSLRWSRKEVLAYLERKQRERDRESSQ